MLDPDARFGCSFLYECAASVVRAADHDDRLWRILGLELQKLESEANRDCTSPRNLSHRKRGVSTIFICGGR